MSSDSESESSIPEMVSLRSPAIVDSDLDTSDEMEGENEDINELPSGEANAGEAVQLGPFGINQELTDARRKEHEYCLQHGEPISPEAVRARAESPAEPPAMDPLGETGLLAPAANEDAEFPSHNPAGVTAPSSPEAHKAPKEDLTADAEDMEPDDESPGCLLEEGGDDLSDGEQKPATTSHANVASTVETTKEPTMSTSSDKHEALFDEPAAAAKAWDRPPSAGLLAELFEEQQEYNKLFGNETEAQRKNRCMEMRWKYAMGFLVESESEDDGSSSELMEVDSPATEAELFASLAPDDLDESSAVHEVGLPPAERTDPSLMNAFPKTLEPKRTAGHEEQEQPLDGVSGAQDSSGSLQNALMAREPANEASGSTVEGRHGHTDLDATLADGEAAAVAVENQWYCCDKAADARANPVTCGDKTKLTEETEQRPKESGSNTAAENLRRQLYAVLDDLSVDCPEELASTSVESGAIPKPFEVDLLKENATPEKSSGPTKLVVGHTRFGSRDNPCHGQLTKERLAMQSEAMTDDESPGRLPGENVDDLDRILDDERKPASIPHANVASEKTNSSAASKPQKSSVVAAVAKSTQKSSPGLLDPSFSSPPKATIGKGEGDECMPFPDSVDNPMAMDESSLMLEVGSPPATRATGKTNPSPAASKHGSAEESPSIGGPAVLSPAETSASSSDPTVLDSAKHNPREVTFQPTAREYINAFAAALGEEIPNDVTPEFLHQRLESKNGLVIEHINGQDMPEGELENLCSSSSMIIRGHKHDFGRGMTEIYAFWNCASEKLACKGKGKWAYHRNKGVDLYKIFTDIENVTTIMPSSG